MRFFQICFLVLCLSACQPEEYTLHLVGDSTMADKVDPAINPEHGWGQVLPEFFDDKVRIVNHAKNGRSTRSFIAEGRWQEVMDQVQPGDYVCIQFGHNDQKVTNPLRYTSPYAGYRTNLEKMIKETKAKSAYPIIFSSIVRRKFNEEGVLVDTHGPYPYVARLTAKEQNVPFVDMQVATEKFVEGLGDAASKKIYLWIAPGTNDYLPEGIQDNTHFSNQGAKEMCRLAISEMEKHDFEFLKYLKQ